MSSLIFHTDETQVLIATDTLATLSDGEPFMFNAKAFIIPHLKMIMAGTGAGIGYSTDKSFGLSNRFSEQLVALEEPHPLTIQSIFLYSTA